MIGKYYRVLDKGFVGLVDYIGSDELIEAAARNSYGKGTRKVNETKGLINYLIRMAHTSPLEMCEFIFHIKMPMDCHRQHVRHRTANLSEYSTRYSVAIDECQQTSPDEWRLQSKDNKQGSSGSLALWPLGVNLFDGEFEYEEDNKKYKERHTPGEYLSAREKDLQEKAREVYEERLKFGVAREQARKDLPLSNYTTMYWKMDLHNLFHYLKLRLDSHAQQEIREYAKVFAGFVKAICPMAWSAFERYKLYARNFTYADLSLLLECDKLKVLWGLGRTVRADYEQYLVGAGVYDKLEMGKREINEFWDKLTPPLKENYDLNEEQVIQYVE